MDNTPGVELPQYRSHKVVRAAKITELRENDPAWTMPANATLELRDVSVTEVAP